MSDPREPKMIRMSDALSDAWEWWSALQPFEQEDYVLQLYIKKHDIDESRLQP